MDSSKITPNTLLIMKQATKKICAVVTYSYTMARLADQAGVDLILVGDSAARVVLGLPTHAPMRLEDMVYHTQAVSRACQRACVMADLPQRTMAEGLQACVSGAMTLISDGDAACIKVEGGSTQALRIIEAIAEVGIPVVCHFSMPSTIVDRLGTYRPWDASNADSNNKPWNYLEQASRFESAGSCAMLLSKIDPEIAREITLATHIPTIGIGSGPHCDGQILVLEDLLGLAQRDHPYYVKKYANLGELADQALRTYFQEVRQGIYPEESYSRPN